MVYLKRASKEIEDKILEKTEKVNAEYHLPTERDLKVYLRLKDDGSFFMQPNGKVGMALLSDRELLRRITSGEVFSVQGSI